MNPGSVIEQQRKAARYDFAAWAAQFLIPCFHCFEQEVIRDGLVRMTKPAGVYGNPGRSIQEVFVVLERDLLQMLGDMNAERQRKIGMRCQTLVLQRMAIIVARERGDSAVISLSNRMLDTEPDNLLLTHAARPRAWQKSPRALPPP